MADTPSEMYERIDAAIKASGMTNAEVSRHFEIHRMSVGNWRRPKERGGVRPDHDKLLTLARLLKVRIEWLLAGEGPMQDDRGGLPPVDPNRRYLDQDLLAEICAKIDDLAKTDGLTLGARAALLVAITVYDEIARSRASSRKPLPIPDKIIRTPLRLIAGYKS